MAKACFHCMRILVILFNLIFVLIGCAILGIAIFVYVDKTLKGIKDSMEEKKLIWDIVLFSAIGVGGITIIVSTFGCCGAYHESECLLGTYFLCLFIIVAAEVAAGVLLFIKAGDEVSVRQIVNKGLLSSINSYMEDSNTGPPPFHLQQIQRRLQCCGADGPTDYAKATIMSSLPHAKLAKAAKACLPDEADITAAITNLQSLTTGCTDKAMKIIIDNKPWVLIAIVVIAAFELLTMIVAMSLCCTVRRMESGYIGVST